MRRLPSHLAGNRSDDLRGAFLEAMSHTAASVTIVTTDGSAGRAGVTVSAMTSVSADTPGPCLLVCLHRLGVAGPVLLKNGRFCVNVLRDDQAKISETFAGRCVAPGGDKFACTAWSDLWPGAPRVIDPLVAFACRLTRSQSVGTHHVIFGEVEEVFIAPDGLPLIYTNRAYGTALPLA